MTKTHTISPIHAIRMATFTLIITLTTLMWQAGQVTAQDSAETPAAQPKVHTSTESEKSSYFQSIKAASLHKDPLGPIITRVQSGQPAQLAGLQTNDIIVGLDGVRIFTVNEYYSQRFRKGYNAPVTIHVWRRGQRHDINILYPKPYRRGGFSFQDRYFDLQAELAKANIDLSHPAINAAKLSPHQLMPLLARLPGRLQESIRLYIHDKKHQSWLRLVVIAELLLQREQHTAAAAVLADLPSTGATSPSPFLSEAAAIYDALATHGPLSNKSDLLALAKGDATALAHLFPYPAMDTTDPISLLGDNDFKEKLQWKLSGRSNDAKRQAGNFANRGRDSERYLNQVRAAMLDSQRHGGWPFRSSMVWRGAQRQNTVRDLKDRLKSHPQEALMIHLALISPAIIDNDTEAFKTHYREIAKGGALFRQTATSFINGATRYHGKRPDINKALAEVQKEHAIPEAYSIMAKRQLETRQRFNKGFYAGTEGLDKYLRKNAYLVERGITTPFNQTKHNALYASISDASTPAELAAAWTTIQSNMEATWSKSVAQSFVSIGQRVSMGELTEAAIRIMAYRGPGGKNLGYAVHIPDLRDAWVAYDNAHLTHVARDAKAATDEAQLNALVTKHGTPAITAMLANAAKSKNLGTLALALQKRADRAFRAGYGFSNDLADYAYAARHLSGYNYFSYLSVFFTEQIQGSHPVIGDMAQVLIGIHRRDWNHVTRHALRYGIRHTEDNMAWHFENQRHTNGLSLIQHHMPQWLIDHPPTLNQKISLRLIDPVRSLVPITDADNPNQLLENIKQLDNQNDVFGILDLAVLWHRAQVFDPIPDSLSTLIKANLGESGQALINALAPYIAPGSTTPPDYRTSDFLNNTPLPDGFIVGLDTAQAKRSLAILSHMWQLPYERGAVKDKWTPTLETLLSDSPVGASLSIFKTRLFNPSHRNHWKTLYDTAVHGLIEPYDQRTQNYNKIINTLNAQSTEKDYDALAALHGTPTLLLFLAKHAKDNKKGKLSERLAADVTRWVNGYNAYGQDQKHSSWHAVLTYYPVPGFEQETIRMLDNAIRFGNRGTTHLMKAEMQIINNELKDALSSLKDANRHLKNASNFYNRMGKLVDATSHRQHILALLLQHKDADEDMVQRVKSEFPQDSAILASVLDSKKYSGDIKEGTTIPDPHRKGAWVITKGGVLLFNENGRITSYKDAYKYTDYTKLRVNSVVATKDSVWIGTNHGLFAMTNQQKYWNEYAINLDSVDEPIASLTLKANQLVVTYGKAKRRATYDITNKRWAAP